MDLLNDETLKETLAKLKANQPTKLQIEQNKTRIAYDLLSKFDRHLENGTLNLAFGTFFITQLNKYKITPEILSHYKFKSIHDINRMGITFRIETTTGNGHWRLEQLIFDYFCMNNNNTFVYNPAPFFYTTTPPVPQVYDKLIQAGKNHKPNIFQRFLALWKKK